MNEVLATRELMETLRLEYQKEFETARHIDNKSSNMLAAAGTVTGLLFGFGTFLVSNLDPNYQYVYHAIILLVIAIVTNIVSVFLCVFAFKMLRYEYVIRANYFLKDCDYSEQAIEGAENYDEELINSEMQKEIADFEKDLIHDYITCNKLNQSINNRKGNRVLWAQMIFLVSLIIIPILVGVLLNAFLEGKIRIV